jgi:hypothetical protein
LLRAGGDDERLKVGCSGLATRALAQGGQLGRGLKNAALHHDMSVGDRCGSSGRQTKKKRVLLQTEAR